MMPAKRITPWLLYGLIGTSGALLLACAGTPQPQTQQQSNGTKAEPHVEAQTTPSPNLALAVPPPTQLAAANVPPKLPPPKPTEIRDAVVRVFKKAATSDINAQQSFVVGDFN